MAEGAGSALLVPPKSGGSDPPSDEGPGGASAWFFFPAFVLGGLAKSLKEIKKTPYRLVVIAFLVGPFGAAMVDISITRVLVMNLPFALMIFLGFDCVLGWSGANSRSVKLS